MCFYSVDDCDWVAEVYESGDRIADKELKCDECFQSVKVGEPCRWVFMQQYEECRRCEWEELEPEAVACEHHEYGETYDYSCCVRCQRILGVIEAIEKEEGCPERYRQPLLGELSTVFWEQSDADKYASRVILEHPELKDHKFLRLFFGE